jgi:hypothetical protein
MTDPPPARSSAVRRTVMQTGHFADDGESEAPPVGRAVDHAGIDARTPIGHREVRPPADRSADPEKIVDPRGDILSALSTRLPTPGRGSPDPLDDRGAGIDSEDTPLASTLAAQSVADGLRHIGEVEVDHQHLAHLETRHRQQLLDHPPHLITRPGHQLPVSRQSSTVAPGIVEGHLDVGADHSQRCPQVVRRLGEQLPLGTERRSSRSSIASNVPAIREFIRRSGQPDASGEVRGFDLLGDGRDPSERPQRPARGEPADDEGENEQRRRTRSGDSCHLVEDELPHQALESADLLFFDLREQEMVPSTSTAVTSRHHPRVIVRPTDGVEHRQVDDSQRQAADAEHDGRRDPRQPEPERLGDRGQVHPIRKAIDAGVTAR